MSDQTRETDVSDNGSMVWQLGSSPEIIAKNRIDEIKTMFLVGSDQLPNQFKPFFYMVLRHSVVDLGMSLDAAIVNVYPRLMDAIGGRGQNNILRGEQTLKGIPTQPETPPEKPGILDRLMDGEKVKEYERYKERKELGLE